VSEPTDFTDEDARAFVAEREWRFATTYVARGLPHEYAVRPFKAPEGPERTAGFEAFKRFERWIRRTSDSRTRLNYKGRSLDGWQYWATWPVINRVGWCHDCSLQLEHCEHAPLVEADHFGVDPDSGGAP
jgi:hypothetical protein